jgi:hypothetical protein
VFPLNNVHPEIVTTKGVINCTSGERGKNVSIVACCSASCALIPPFVIFKEVRFRKIYKQVLPARSENAMADSGYINDDIFLKHLQHFQKHRSPGEDGHSFYSWLTSLNCCRQTGTETLFLHPHTTHVLPPFERTLFKPIKIYHHQKATKFMYENPNIAIGKFSFRKFSPQLGKKAQKLETLSEVLSGYGPSDIPEDKFLPSTYFLQNSANLPSASTHKIPSESHKPSGPPVLQSTSDLNEAV